MLVPFFQFLTAHSLTKCNCINKRLVHYLSTRKPFTLQQLACHLSNNRFGTWWAMSFRHSRNTLLSHVAIQIFHQCVQVNAVWRQARRCRRHCVSGWHWQWAVWLSWNHCSTTTLRQWLLVGWHGSFHRTRLCHACSPSRQLISIWFLQMITRDNYYYKAAGNEANKLVFSSYSY